MTTKTKPSSKKFIHEINKKVGCQTITSYRVIVRKRDPISKRLYSYTRVFKTLSDAKDFRDRVVDEIETAIATGEKPGFEKPVVTLQDCYNKYYPHREMKCEDRLKAIYKPLYAYFASRDVALLSSSDIGDYIDQRKTKEKVDKKTGKVVTIKISNATIRKELFLLFIILSYYPKNDEQVIKFSQLATLVKNRYSQYFTASPKREGRITDEQCELLKTAYPQLADIFDFAVHTGIRLSEITSIKWEYVHNDGIHLPAEITKTQKARTIPFDNAEFKTRLLAKHGKDEEFLFNFTPSWISHACTKAVRKAGLSASGKTKISFHSFRHEYASRLFQSGMQLSEIQKRTGHASLQALERYIHND